MNEIRACKGLGIEEENYTVKIKSIYLLSAIIALLMAVVSLGGLFINNLYRDGSKFILTAWYGNDLVTLIIALPVFIGALFLNMKGSQRGLLIWLGMLDFIVYNFAFYLFGAAFNWFFPAYVALFTLGIFTFIFGMIEIDIEKIRHNITDKLTFRGVSIYMFIWAAILGAAWIGQWVGFVLTGNLPQIIIETGSSINLVAALDLSLVVPIGFLAGIWLLKQRPWGYVLAVISNVKGSVYTLVLVAGSIFQAQSGVKGALDLVPLWIFLFLGCLFSSIYLLRYCSIAVVEKAGLTE